jgi:hypothetical protein
MGAMFQNCGRPPLPSLLVAVAVGPVPTPVDVIVICDAREAAEVVAV